MAVIEAYNSIKLISRKIGVAVKLLICHTVWCVSTYKHLERRFPFQRKVDQKEALLKYYYRK